MIIIFTAAMCITGICLAKMIMDGAAFYRDVNKQWEDDRDE